MDKQNHYSVSGSKLLQNGITEMPTIITPILPKAGVFAQEDESIVVEAEGNVADIPSNTITFEQDNNSSNISKGIQTLNTAVDKTFGGDEVGTANSINYKLKEKEEIASIADIAPLQTGEQVHNNIYEQEQGGKESVGKPLNTPCFPKWIYSHLPATIAIGCDAFQDEREKDIYLTGAITVLSGCLPMVTGKYRGDEVYSNLFAFIIAPPASGKGVLKHAKKLGENYDKAIVAESEAKYRTYEQEKIKYERSKNRGDSPLPIEPPRRMLFLPANNSSAGLIQCLHDSGGRGIMAETEADTLSNAIKQDWGGFSDLLRKAFHHEHISYSRKGKRELINIYFPQLSVLLSGTPNQVLSLIRSSEDGLFSRFMFYDFETEIEWKEVGAFYDGVDLKKHFEGLSTRVCELFNLQRKQQQINFELTEEQWRELNAFGSRSLAQLSTFVSDDLAGTSKRLGLILFRIAMVLTAIRNFDNNVSAKTYLCSEEDFAIALALVTVFQEHAVKVFKQLPKSSPSENPGLNSLYNSLPQEFTRMEAIEIAKNLNIAPRTADEYLSKLNNRRLLVKQKMGYYIKTT